MELGLLEPFFQMHMKGTIRRKIILKQNAIKLKIKLIKERVGGRMVYG